MRTITTIGLTAVLAVAVTGCSVLGGASDPPASSAPTSDAPPPATSAPASSNDPTASTTGSPSATPTGTDPATAAPTPADPNQPGAGSELGQSVATRTSSKGGKKVTVTLYPVLRSGTTSTVNYTLSSPVDSTDRLQVADLLSDGDYKASDSTGLAGDGLQLVDGKNSKLYLVASDGVGNCLCSRSLSSVFLSGNVPVVLSATFAAPPADVTIVDVKIPNFGTVKDVPVQ
ncbi:hypothetical protein [uncultured Friedmanniella sp.]|uniref:hypothetical protein n=1 Tax=uncultured Friedmanniella sp. TaxID=335381 RepID=UPI0035CB8ECE